ncbi:MAG: hypothetical protein RL112_473 [Planctomycetota bacterium]
MVERMELVDQESIRRGDPRSGSSSLLDAWRRGVGERASDEVLSLLEEVGGLRWARGGAGAARSNNLQAAAEAELRRVHADELVQLCQLLAWTELMRLSGAAGATNGLERGSTEPPSISRLDQLAPTARRLAVDEGRIDLVSVARGATRACVADLCALEQSLRPGPVPIIHSIGAAQLLGDWSANDAELEALLARTVDPRHSAACCHLLEAAARRRGDWLRGARWNWRAATFLPGRVEGWLLALRGACRAGDELMARQAARTLDEFGVGVVRHALRGGWRRRDGDLGRGEAATAPRVRAMIDERHGDWSREAWIHG